MDPWNPVISRRRERPTASPVVPITPRQEAQTVSNSPSPTNDVVEYMKARDAQRQKTRSRWIVGIVVTGLLLGVGYLASEVMEEQRLEEERIENLFGG